LVDRVATILVLISLCIAGAALSAYLLRELWLAWRARRLASRMELLRSLLDAQDPDARAFKTLRRRPSTWRDLEALEHLLEERRARLAPDATLEETQTLYATYDQLGIVERYVHKLQNSRGWAERAFAARYLGEIGSARAVAPLVETMRNTREEDRDVRMAASRALGRIRDPRAIEPLLEALDAPESWLPARVAEVILQFGDMSFDALVGLLGRQEDSGARPWAAQILGDLGNSRAVPVLLGCLTDLNDQVRARSGERAREPRGPPRRSRAHPHHAERSGAVRAHPGCARFGRARGTRARSITSSTRSWTASGGCASASSRRSSSWRPSGRAALPGARRPRHRSAPARCHDARTPRRPRRSHRPAGRDGCAARDKLLAAGQAGVVEILIEALENEDARVRFVVVEILGEVRHSGVEVALIGRLETEADPRIRAAVVRSLAQQQSSKAAVPISKLLGDPDERIRVEAVRALERIQVPDPHVSPGGRDAGSAAARARRRRGRPRQGGRCARRGAAHRLAVGCRCFGARRSSPRCRLAAGRRSRRPSRRSVPRHRRASAGGSREGPRTDRLDRLPRNARPRSRERQRRTRCAAIAWALGQIRWDDPDRLIDVLFQGNDRSSRLGHSQPSARSGTTRAASSSAPCSTTPMRRSWSKPSPSSASCAMRPLCPSCRRCSRVLSKRPGSR
jgi:HEAT repeat protein